MTESENILIQISEFVFTEMDGIKSVEHLTENSFVVKTDDGIEYIVEIKQKV